MLSPNEADNPIEPASLSTAESQSADEDLVLEDEAEESNPQARIKKLREQLRLCQSERQEYLDGWQRTKADFINARKEEEQGRQQLLKYAKVDLIHEILPIVDNFERAIANKEAWEKVEQNWRLGVEYIYTQLTKVLSDHGVESLGRVGDKFDPNLHQSTEALPSDDPLKDETVAFIFEKGYRYQGRLIRPARVKIWHHNTSEVIN